MKKKIRPQSSAHGREHARAHASRRQAEILNFSFLYTSEKKRDGEDSLDLSRTRARARSLYARSTRLFLFSYFLLQSVFACVKYTELLSSVKYNIKNPELYCVVLWLWKLRCGRLARAPFSLYTYVHRIYHHIFIRGGISNIYAVCTVHADRPNDYVIFIPFWIINYISYFAA